MWIPHKSIKLLRKYEQSLFHKNFTTNGRIYAFYLLLLPAFEWVRPLLADKGLCKDEVESELYLLADKLFHKYNRSKSSLIPYLEKYFSYTVSDHLKGIGVSSLEVLNGLVEREESQYIDENYYFSAPNILTNDKYIGKCFTKSEKYLIFKILMADSDRLTTRKLSQDLNISREVLRLKFKDIKEVLINGGYNENSRTRP